MQTNRKLIIDGWAVDICHQCLIPPFKPFYGKAEKILEGGKKVKMFSVEGSSYDEVAEKIRKRINENSSK